MGAGAMTGVSVRSETTRRAQRNERRGFTRHVVGIVLLVAFWAVFVAIKHPSSIILPSPGEVWSRLLQLLSTRAFWLDIATSLREFALGLAIGGISGTVIGAIMGASPKAM
jgi:ABC-type nitrate/sulfonate/bicarbonate transport system permease component